ncbi:MAG: glycine zipper family protein [Hyphomonas sp.]
MIAYLKVAAIGAGALAMAACTSSGTAERNAAVGAGLGAVAGAAIGNNVGDGNATRGAAIGAAAGGVAGAVRGCSQAGDCGTSNRPANYDPYNYDSDGDGVVDARDRYPDDPRRW